MHIRTDIPLLFFKGALICMFIATVVLITVVLLDPFATQPQFRDRKRAQDMSQFFTFLTEYLNSPLVLSSGISGEMHQIGTATTGCALQTSHCSIASDVCLNLRYILPDPSLDLPQDPQVGTVSKTGYGVVLEAPGKIKIVACHSENSQIEEGREFEKELSTYEKVKNEKRR